FDHGSFSLRRFSTHPCGLVGQVSLAHVHGQHTFRTRAWPRGLFSVEVTGFKTGSRILKCVLELCRERSRLLRLGLVKPGLLSQASAL
ncbi:MAG: hypothetical protein WCA79_08660, partial [Anaerolineales bacterium]